jgi:hypothetical protein
MQQSDPPTRHLRLSKKYEPWAPHYCDVQEKKGKTLPSTSGSKIGIEDVDWLGSLKEFAICNKPVHIYIGTYISIKCTTWKELQMQK